MGADIFELSRYRLVMKQGASVAENIDNVQQSLHVLIIIYPNREAAEKAANFYFEWMQLFVYRHKILWCYGQSRLLKQAIKTYFSIIEDQQEMIEQGLKTGRTLEDLGSLLQEVQGILNKYTIDLNRLEFQSSTIDINASNYRKRWVRIEEKSRAQVATASESSRAHSDLFFFKKFSNLVRDKYQFQIHKDSQNLQRGQKLLVNIINVVRGRVEVEQADREEKFQDLITILGVGWAAGSFVKDSTGEIQMSDRNFPENIVNYIEPLVYPASVAIAVALLTGWVKSLCERSDFFSRVFGLLVGHVGKK